jgi:hypothetical protein
MYIAIHSHATFLPTHSSTISSVCFSACLLPLSRPNVCIFRHSLCQYFARPCKNPPSRNILICNFAVYLGIYMHKLVHKLCIVKVTLIYLFCICVERLRLSISDLLASQHRSKKKKLWRLVRHTAGGSADSGREGREAGRNGRTWGIGSGTHVLEVERQNVLHNYPHNRVCT